MAGVFLSYDRDDSDRARHFARVLEAAGHTVWWDLHVRGGAQFGKVIEEALKAADAVVVLWSKNSIESPWVKDEASAGRDSGRLVPVAIDGTEPPLGFRQFQTIDLSRWKGRGTPAPLRILLADIDALGLSRTSAPASPPPGRVSEPGRARRSGRAFVVGALALLALIIAAGSYWLLRGNASNSTTVAVVAADSAAVSQQLARNLLVKLGALQGNSAMNVDLIDERAANGGADLQLAVNAAERGGQLHASVALTSGDSKAMLWSKEFEQPVSARSQVEEALAFATARVLGCAIEEASGEYGRLPEKLRRMYLNACAALAEVGWDSQTVLPQLRQVTKQAPKFRPAWAKLVMAQADYVSLLQSMGQDPSGDDTSTARAELRQYVDAARNVDPNMAEATVAELSLHTNLPVARVIALADKAKTQDPRNSAALAAHAGVMQLVGRMADAVADAERAAELDPLSANMRAELIRTLLYAGQIERARTELAKAKQLWPGTQVIREAEFSIELRAGDFDKVVRAEGWAGPGVDLYAEALRTPNDANVRAFVEYIQRDPNNLAEMGLAVQGLGQMKRPNEFYALASQFKPFHYEALRRDSYILFRPWMSSIRRDPRFMQLSSRLGLTAYWRSTGKWPDFCRDPDLLYDCKVEAAKYG
jgi:tetratricopeptide (TPR) repeat protein